MRLSLSATSFLRAFVVAALACAALPARAQDAYPNQTIRFIVPYAPGGNADVPARLFANVMSRNLGVSVIVENRPGASGVPGSEYVRRAKPDGYTLLWSTSASHSVSVVAMAPLPYDPIQDFSPITLFSRDTNVLVSSPDIKTEGVQGILDYLKAHPRSPVGNSGPATSGRFAMELLKATLGVDTVQVPYKSTGPLLTDLAGGQIPFGIMGASTALPFLKDHRIRAHFVTSLTRSRVLTDIPTLNETVAPGFDAVAWSALFAPPKTPAPVIAKILAAVRQAAQAPEAKRWLDESGLDVPLSSPEELTAFMRTDIARWVKVAKDNNLSFNNDN